jgi:hypothetical protein
VGALASALVLASCDSQGLTAPPVGAGWQQGTGTATLTAAGGSVAELGLAALRLPASWSVGWAAKHCPDGAGSCVPCSRADPAGNDVVNLSPYAPTGACRAVAGQASVWLVPAPAGGGARHRGIAGGGVEVEVPLARATAYGYGTAGIEVAESLGPSSLDELLGHLGRLPTAPASWHREAFGPLSLAVPGTWPATRLSSRQDPPVAVNNPCGLRPAFARPWLLLGGAAHEVAFCPLEAFLLRDAATPGDGVWVLATASRHLFPLNTFLPVADYALRQLRIDGLAVRLWYPIDSAPAGEVFAVVSTPDGGIGIRLGVGATATTAERILGSLRAAPSS